VKKMRKYLEDVKNNSLPPNLVEKIIKPRCREIYLSVALPHYDSDVSHYEGVLRAYNCDYQEPITLH
ncbi:hypothetical protein J3U35_03160, partial [Gilliamella sp. B2717]|uniref:hypothetical protein n=1 Tax=Gilliamella sp. B2717 TaxID=2817996 RepID=UPI00226AD15F